MKRITSVTSLCGTSGTDLETLEARRLLSGSGGILPELPSHLVGKPSDAVMLERGYERVEWQNGVHWMKPSEWKIGFERPQIELFPTQGGSSEEIDRISQIEGLGLGIKVEKTLGSPHSLLVKVPAGLDIDVLQRALKGLDGFKSIAPNAILTSSQQGGISSGRALIIDELSSFEQSLSDKAVLHLKLDLPPKIIDMGNIQAIDHTKPWEGTEALVQQIVTQIEAFAPGVTVTGGEIFMGDRGQFFIELGDMTREAFAEAVASLGGRVSALPEGRFTVAPTYAWGERYSDFVQTPVAQVPEDMPQNTKVLPKHIWNLSPSKGTLIDVENDDDAILRLTIPAAKLIA